jgi:hypothetical protein
MPRVHNVTFGSVLNIDKSDIENLPKEMDCLACILAAADIEVQVMISAECEPGCEASWSDPGYRASASFVECEIIDIGIYGETNECSEAIELLMTKEQKKALEDFTSYLIELKWDDYEDEALSQED